MAQNVASPGGSAQKRPSLLLPVGFFALFVAGVIGLFIPHVPFKPDVGFDPDGLATMDVVLSPGSTAADPVDEVKGRPGIASAGAISTLPFDPAPTVTIEADGLFNHTSAFCHLVTPDYLAAMVPPNVILDGRTFGAADIGAVPSEVVLGEVSVREVDPGLMGQKITITPDGAVPFQATVVALIRSVAHGVESARAIDLYLPDTATGAGCSAVASRQRTIVARGVTPGAAEQALKKLAETSFSSFQILRVTSMNDRLIGAGLRKPPNTAFAVQTLSAVVIGLTGFVISMIRRRRAA
jgi:hypothetical protein